MQYLQKMRKTVSLFIAILISMFLYSQANVNSTIQEISSNPVMPFGKFILEMPFGAKLYLAEYTTAPEFVDNLKSSFKGKALFIDFWGTWCTSCIQAMPNNKKMYIETKDLPREFIYMCNSAGTSIDAWITKISVLKLPGIHLFLDDTFETEVEKFFSVGGYPGYVFIDKNGVYRQGAIPVNESTSSDKLRQLIKK